MNMKTVEMSVAREWEVGRVLAQSHAGTGCRCGACIRHGGEFRPLSKTQIKKERRAALAQGGGK